MADADWEQKKLCELLSVLDDQFQIFRGVDSDGCPCLVLLGRGERVDDVYVGVKQLLNEMGGTSYRVEDVEDKLKN